jgi:hypothetical protein
MNHKKSLVNEVGGWKRLIIWLGVAVAISLILTLVGVGKADAACVEEDGTNCDSTSDVAAAFRDGQFNNSRDIFLPRNVRRFANNQTSAKMTSTAEAGVSDWWDDTLRKTRCLMWGGMRSSCTRPSWFRNTTDPMYQGMKQATRMVVTCSANAIMTGTTTETLRGLIKENPDEVPKHVKQFIRNFSGRMFWAATGVGGTTCMYNKLKEKMGPISFFGF